MKVTKARLARDLKDARAVIETLRDNLAAVEKRAEKESASARAAELRVARLEGWCDRVREVERVHAPKMPSVDHDLSRYLSTSRAFDPLDTATIRSTHVIPAWRGK